MDPHHDTPFGFAFDSLFAVCIREYREENTIGSRRRLDNKGHKSLVRALVEVLQLLA